jgi:ATP/maltotriose-dependent transcriptional regulator MalT
MNSTRLVPPRPREKFTVTASGERDKRQRAPAEVAALRGQRLGAHRPCEAALDRLSCREREVLRLLAIRYSDREIADALFISYRTVTTHVTNILNKLGVDSRREAAAAFSLYDEP